MDTISISEESIQPTKGFLLIDAPELVTQTASGVVLANNEDGGVPTIGLILKVGEGCTKKIGQKVLFRRYSLDEIKIKTPEGEKVFNLLEEINVLATVE